MNKDNVEYFFTTPDFDLMMVNRSQGESLNASLLIASGYKVHGPYKTRFKAVRGAMGMLNEKVKKVINWKKKV